MIANLSDAMAELRRTADECERLRAEIERLRFIENEHQLLVETIRALRPLIDPALQPPEEGGP